MGDFLRHIHFWDHIASKEFQKRALKLIIYAYATSLEYAKINLVQKFKTSF